MVVYQHLLNVNIFTMPKERKHAMLSDEPKTENAKLGHLHFIA